MTPVDPGRRAQAKRLALMAVVAVLLATVVAASIGEDPARSADDYPHASFTFSVSNDSVVVEHAAGDALNGSRVFVESADRGRLGNVAGTDGLACRAVVSRLTVGSTCRVPDAAHEQLYVVWDGPGNRSLIIGRRGPDAGTASGSTTGAPQPTANPTDTRTRTGAVDTRSRTATTSTAARTDSLTATRTPTATTTATRRSTTTVSGNSTDSTGSTAP